MRKSFFTGFMAILLSSAITGSSYSQARFEVPGPQASGQEMITSTENTNAGNSEVPARRNEINSKAARDFARRYRDVADGEWFKAKDGFIVHFVSNDIRCRAFYSKEGYYEGLIRSYFEDQLPREIRHIVKSTYYDFSICHIYEFNVESATTYLVKMKGKTSWKTVKVLNGEMDVVGEYQVQQPGL